RARRSVGTQDRAQAAQPRSHVRLAAARTPDRRMGRVRRRRAPRRASPNPRGAVGAAREHRIQRGLLRRDRIGAGRDGTALDDAALRRPHLRRCAPPHHRVPRRLQSRSVAPSKRNAETDQRLAARARGQLRRASRGAGRQRARGRAPRMTRLVCALLDTSSGVDRALAGRARDLTVSWLRWGYFGDILEDASVDAILARADGEYDYCLIQGWGHVVAENAGPNGGKGVDFLRAAL